MYKVKNCLTEDCLRPAFARGMCNTCYKFWQRHNPGLAKRPSVAERFWAKVNRLGEDDCWEWLASSQPHGYGQFAPGGRAGGMTTAHRVAYELTFGPIPEGLSIDHLCRNRGCVNPAHLEAVSQRVNVLRGESPAAAHAQQTHCVNGHEFDLLNTYISGGARVCRACKKDADERRSPRRHR